MSAAKAPNGDCGHWDNLEAESPPTWAELLTNYGVRSTEDLVIRSVADRLSRHFIACSQLANSDNLVDYWTVLSSLATITGAAEDRLPS